MPDREKVIKAVECMKNAHKRCGNPCEMTGLCAYASQVRSPDGEPYYPFYCDTERLCVDVLALLREQEPVEPKEESGLVSAFKVYSCGHCDTAFLLRRQKYCANCGRKVKWDD